MSVSALVAISVAVLTTGCADVQSERGQADQADHAEAERGEPGDAVVAESAQSAAGRVGSHGMVLAGDPSGAVLSHIPMYAAPHDVQLVVSGQMTVESGPALPATFSDRPYTFLPARTSLDALRTGVTRELRGTVYLGNFEQGGRPVASNVRFAVDHVVHQHLLVTQPVVDAGPSPNGELTYLVFGSRAHAFAVHYIAAAPSFDEVLAVSLSPADAPTDAELAAGVIAHVAGAQDVASARLGPHTTSDVSLTIGTGPKRVTIRPLATLSCLEGPDFFGPCQ